LSLACIPFTVEGSADRFSEGPANGLLSSGKNYFTALQHSKLNWTRRTYLI
jgi:hypothetical protein